MYVYGRDREKGRGLRITTGHKLECPGGGECAQSLQGCRLILGSEMEAQETYAPRDRGGYGKKRGQDKGR